MESRFCFVTLLLMFAACSKEAPAPVAMPEPEPVSRPNLPLVVYAAMPGSRVQSVFDAYTAETGNKVDVRSTDDGNAGRTVNVEALPDADLYLFGNLASLWSVAERDGFRPTFSVSIDDNIPVELRDPESRWTGLATSARLVVYNTELLAEEMLGDINNYAALGAKQWRGKLCLSSSTVPGNISLVASLIRHYELRDAEIAVRRWRANLASDVLADDATLLEAIASGRCQIGIAASNALAAHLAANAGASLGFLPFADPEQTVVDVSGAGVSRHAHNPEGAAELLIWLSTNAPNALYAALGHEFPANADSRTAPGIESWRGTVAAPAQQSVLAFLHDEAVLLVERARYY
jgi:iron(III) transport system substrate-binding protein